MGEVEVWVLDEEVAAWLYELGEAFDELVALGEVVQHHSGVDDIELG